MAILDKILPRSLSKKSEEKKESLFERMRGLGGNTLYYPGCLTKFVASDLMDNYRLIFKKIGVDFIELKELEVCCGSPVLKAAFAGDFKNLAEKNDFKGARGFC